MTPTETLTSAAQALIRALYPAPSKMDILRVIARMWDYAPDADQNRAYAELCRRYGL